MRVHALSVAAVLLALGVAGCTVHGGSGYSRPYGWGYADRSPYAYGPSTGYLHGSRYPWWSAYDRSWHDDDRDPLSQKQVVRGLERRGYDDFDDIDKRHGFYVVEARDRKGRPVRLEIDPYNGRVIDEDKQ